MPLKTDSTEEPALNLTPMIDIVFLLVIFFMVGSKFSEQPEHDHRVELPTSAAVAPLTSLPDELVVNVLADGSVYLGKQQVSLQELQSELTTAKQNYADQMVRIRGDARVNYQRVMDVLKVVKEGAQITSIALAYDPVGG